LRFIVSLRCGKILHPLSGKEKEPGRLKWSVIIVEALYRANAGGFDGHAVGPARGCGNVCLVTRASKEISMPATPESVVRSWFDELWNRGDETTIDRLLQLIEGWNCFDFMGMYQQLGVLTLNVGNPSVSG
jgi:hypothetical protein